MVQRLPWNMKPAKKSPVIPDSVKAAAEVSAVGFIDTVLAPRHLKPEDQQEQEFNFISGFRANWFRGSFYFIAVYTCPSPAALFPSFESKFARMEYLLNGTFALYGSTDGGKEWTGVYDEVTLEECIRAIGEDPWFEM